MPSIGCLASFEIIAMIVLLYTDYETSASTVSVILPAFAAPAVEARTVATCTAPLRVPPPGV